MPGKRSGASEANPSAQKKSRPDPATEHWQTQVRPLLDDKEAPANMALHLFQTLWQKCGKDVALEAVQPMCDDIQQKTEQNSNIDGKWKLGENHGTLIFANNCCSWPEGECELYLESSASASELVFKGGLMQYSNCRDDFDVTLTVTYDYDSDTIEGNIDVSHVSEPDYGPSFGDCLYFTGERDDDE